MPQAAAKSKQQKRPRLPEAKSIPTGKSTIAKLAKLAASQLHVDWRGTEKDGPIYAVGDIHGMANLLDKMIRKINRDAGKSGVPARVIFLGDVINRGPQSFDVVERLLEGPDDNGDSWLVLRGNHEQALLDGLNDEIAFQRFLHKGGVQTLQSYGVSRSRLDAKGAHAAIPADHLNFLSTTALTCRTRSHLFVHAGMRPGLDLHKQAPEDLMNVREPFFEGAGELPWRIVHGHTPTAGLPVLAKGRIGVDTGACFSGVLTAAVIEHKKPARFIAVSD